MRGGREGEEEGYRSGVSGRRGRGKREGREEKARGQRDWGLEFKLGSVSVSVSVLEIVLEIVIVLELSLIHI